MTTIKAPSNTHVPKLIELFTKTTIPKLLLLALICTSCTNNNSISENMTNSPDKSGSYKITETQLKAKKEQMSISFTNALKNALIQKDLDISDLKVTLVTEETEINFFFSGIGIPNTAIGKQKDRLESGENHLFKISGVDLNQLPKDFTASSIPGTDCHKLTQNGLILLSNNAKISSLSEKYSEPNQRQIRKHHPGRE